MRAIINKFISMAIQTLLMTVMIVLMMANATIVPALRRVMALRRWQVIHQACDTDKEQKEHEHNVEHQQ